MARAYLKLILAQIGSNFKNKILKQKNVSFFIQKAGVSITPCHFRDMGDKPENATFRTWVFTLNNYTDADVERLHKPYDEVKYVAYSKEVGESGTPHLQGYVCMWDPCRLSFFKKYIPRAHMEPMRGRLLDSEKYCSKQSELIEIGERPAQGRRSDLVTVKRRLDAGATPMELAEEENLFPIITKHEKFFSKYSAYKRQKTLEKERWKPDVYIRIGPAGSGKTRWMDEQFGPGSWVFAPDNTGKWFDGCDHDVVCFDDVDSHSIMSLSLFKRLTQEYGMPVPVKGGHIYWKPRVIVFTSNQHWNSWWKDMSAEDIRAIERRVQTVFVA